MGTLKEYQCNSCGYTVTGTRKGRTLVMSGEIETEKVPRKCPKCGGDMKETGTVIMIDQGHKEGSPLRAFFVSKPNDQ